MIREGLADADRLGLIGFCYGGYLPLALTRTNRFKAASVGAAFADLYSLAANQRPALLVEYFGDVPWKARARYERHSPIFAATTPLSHRPCYSIRRTTGESPGRKACKYTMC